MVITIFFEKVCTEISNKFSQVLVLDCKRIITTVVYCVYNVNKESTTSIQTRTGTIFFETF